MLAHELRNPLAPMLNGLEILRNPRTPPPAQQRARDVLQRQLTQMVRLIDDLLDVSRITTGHLTLRRERVDLLAVVRDTIEIVEPTLRQRRHTLSTGLPARPVWVDADPTRLAQIFVNLLNNAAKYTDPDGRISLDVELEEHEVRVRVADNGVGIEPTQQARIFDMFTQADSSLERGGAGLGVGLSLARQLVELHGGHIEVRSGGLGQGAAFTFTLPLLPTPAGAATVGTASGVHTRGGEGGRPRPTAPVFRPAEATTLVETPPPLGPPPLATPPIPSVAGAAEEGGLRVLVADDNVDLATSLGAVLEALGHRPVLANDGHAALDAALSGGFDVALFDIGMPGLNGLELARRLRADPRTHDLAMIAVTGFGRAADRQRSLDAGFDFHLVKPVAPRALIELLQDMAARPRSRRREHADRRARVGSSGARSRR
jgi:CheY-like chemotaxis protein